MSPFLPAALLAATLLGAPPPATPATTSPPAAASAPTPGGCTGTLSGAVTASFGCSVTATIEGKVATVVITVAGPVAGLRALQPGTVSLALPVASGAYSGEALSAASASLETSAGARFAAGRGDVTLTVDQAERYRQSPNHLVMSGALKARLVPARGGTGEVLVEVRF